MRVARRGHDTGGLVERPDLALLERTGAPSTVDAGIARRRRGRGRSSPPLPRSPARRPRAAQRPAARRRHSGRGTWRGARGHCGRGATLGAVDLALLDSTLAPAASPPSAARQVWEWTARGADSYEQMTNLPAALREELAGRGAVLLARARARGEGERRHREGALPHRRRTAARGGADALPRRAPLALPVEPVRLPADLHVLRHRGDAVRPQPDRLGDPRPGAPLPPREAVDHAVFMGMGEPLLNLDAVLATCERLPDLGIATLANTAVSTVGWIPGIERLTTRGTARAPGPVAARRRRVAALGADAGQRALPALRRARGLPRLVERSTASGVRRVPDARRRERPLRAGRGPRRAPRRHASGSRST